MAERKNLKAQLLFMLINICMILPIKASTIKQTIPTESNIITSPIMTSAINLKEQPLLKFGVVSDIHLQASDNLAKTKFSKMLYDMKEHLNVNSIIINGDLGNGNLQDYNLFHNFVMTKGKNIRFYYTIGNHEFYNAYRSKKTNGWSPKTFPNGETEKLAIKRFLSLTGQPYVYYDKYLSGYHFIFLGSEKSAMSGKKYKDKAYLSSNQLAWLREKLKENYSPHKPIFVFLHQPFPNNTTTSWYRSIQGYVIQRDQLKTLLGDYPEVILFSGHTHWKLELGREIAKGPFYVVNDSSVAMPVDAKGKKVPDKSEGLVVNVYNNRVVIKGRDFTSETWIPNTSHELIYKKES